MLDSLITSKTRCKVLLKFFLNSQNKSYLRNMEQEFNESSNAIRMELNHLEVEGFLSSEMIGNRKYFRANTDHILYPDIKNILIKITGIDQVVDRLVSEVRGLRELYLIGELASGVDSKIIDLILVGNDLSSNVEKTLLVEIEKDINRKIRYLELVPAQMQDYFNSKNSMLLWSYQGTNKTK